MWVYTWNTQWTQLLSVKRERERGPVANRDRILISLLLWCRNTQVFVCALTHLDHTHSSSVHSHSCSLILTPSSVSLATSGMDSNNWLPESVKDKRWQRKARERRRQRDKRRWTDWERGRKGGWKEEKEEKEGGRKGGREERLRGGQVILGSTHNAA